MITYLRHLVRVNGDMPSPAILIKARNGNASIMVIDRLSEENVSDLSSFADETAGSSGTEDDIWAELVDTAESSHRS